ncbi:4-(cytidine 5'-diphospho)-2-C-methyl-D-erythritol kinase [soil metagenome]
MVAFPPCKINIGLQILSRRQDGFHTISTCFYPLPWTDVLEILPAEQTQFIQSGNVIPGKNEDNLCLKAYHLLQTDFKIGPVKIHLHKIIPTGAGLGGGSSDAAYTIRMLNTVFDLKLSQKQMMDYASALGSDCSFFIQDSPMIGSGRGEVLDPVVLNLKGFYVVVIKPSIHVSTAEAYNGVTPMPLSATLNSLIGMPVDQWKDRIKNDFELSLFPKYPVIQQVKEKLYQLGALYASMSGSGSSVFGIFRNEIDSRMQFRDSFGWAGKL